MHTHHSMLQKRFGCTQKNNYKAELTSGFPFNHQTPVPILRTIASVLYTKVKQKQAEIAINRVIDYTNNPEKYTEYIEMRADIMLMKG